MSQENAENIVQITLTELGNYCQQALQDNRLIQDLNNTEAGDLYQLILRKIVVLPFVEEADHMGEDNAEKMTKCQGSNAFLSELMFIR